MTNSKGIAWFFVLTLLGLAGNHFRYPVFFSIDFLFGSIFSMLALQLLGSRAGILSALLSGSITYLLWNHPYAIIILSVEAAVVAWLHFRKRLDLVVADTLYWCVLGMPLVYLFYAEVMHLPPGSVTITMLKQAINGLANVLMARLIFMAMTYQSRGIFSLRELVFNALLMFVLIPSLFLMASHSRDEQTQNDRRLRDSLVDTAAGASHNANRWLQEHVDQITALSKLASSTSATKLQTAMEQARLVDSDFLHIGLMNEQAISIAYAPLQDEMGHSLLGKNSADQPYLPELKSKLTPMLSEVVVAQIGSATPIAQVIAPVVNGGQYRGYVSGVLNLENLKNLIANSMAGTSASAASMRFHLLDQKGRVIVSSNPDLGVMTVFGRDIGELISQPDGLTQWFPEAKRNVSVSEKWKDAVYITDTRVGKNSE